MGKTWKSNDSNPFGDLPDLNWMNSTESDRAALKMEREYRYNQMAADAQAARDREEWNRQFDVINAYNDPSAERARLEDAGLSKAAMFEGTLGSQSNATPAGAGGSGFSPSGAGGSSDASIIDSILGIAQTGLNFWKNGTEADLAQAKIDQMRVQNDMYNAQAFMYRQSGRHTEEKINWQKIANYVAGETLDDKITISHNSKEESFKALDLMDEQIREKRGENDIRDDHGMLAGRLAVINLGADIVYKAVETELAAKNIELVGERINECKQHCKTLFAQAYMANSIGDQNFAFITGYYPERDTAGNLIEDSRFPGTGLVGKIPLKGDSPMGKSFKQQGELTPSQIANLVIPAVVQLMMMM